MPDDQQANDDGIVHYEGGIPVFNTRLDKLEKEAREAKDRDDEYKKKQLQLNSRVVWFTGVLAAVGIIGGAISGYQTHISGINAAAAQANAAAAEGMVDEMRKSGNDTHQLALAAGDQAKAAKDSASYSQQFLVASSRAWISPVNAYITSDISKTVPLEFSIAFTNTGRSPALDVHPVYTLDKIPSSKLTDNSINAFIEAKDVCKGITIKPGAQVAYPNLPDTFTFKVNLLGWVDDRVTVGDAIMLARMCFVYRTMKEVHHTSFCYYYQVGTSPPTKQMNVCPVGSHAD